MWPTIGPVRSYGLMYLSAYLVCYLVSWQIARHRGLQTRVWVTAGICFSVSGVFGHHLYIGPIAVSQLLGLGAAVVSITGLLWWRRRSPVT